MKRISAKLALAFFGMAALAVALIWLVQAVFLGDGYLNQRVDSIKTAVDGVTVSADTDPTLAVPAGSARDITFAKQIGS